MKKRDREGKERRKKKGDTIHSFIFIHFNGNNQILLQMYSSLGNKIQYVQEVLPHFAQ